MESQFPLTAQASDNLVHPELQKWTHPFNTIANEFSPTHHILHLDTYRHVSIQTQVCHALVRVLTH